MRSVPIGAVAAVLIGFSLVAWWPRNRGVQPAASEDMLPRPPRRTAAAAPAPAPVLAIVEDSRRLNAPDAPPAEDVAIVAQLLGTYRRHFKESPVGDNEEITAQLLGKGRGRSLVLVDPRNPAIDRQGRLLDRWGTPFFFHALSGRDMEVRSAGPDRTLWTADDVVGE